MLQPNSGASLVQMRSMPRRRNECAPGARGERKLSSAIVTRLIEVVVPPRDAAVVLREVATENFGIRGAECDRDLGFKVDV